MTAISVSPVTRIEGHLAVHAETDPAGDSGDVVVKQARCEGEMFRGIEQILVGRDPLDAQQITQRICGVCPVAHGIASVTAQESAYGIVPTPNGRLEQNLILAANYLQSHILHFYHLAALDFVDLTAILQYTGEDSQLQSLRTWVQNALDRKDVFPAAPFLPRYEGDYVPEVDVNIELLSHYVEALELRRMCHEMGALFGARLPHTTALVPGGCTQRPTIDRVLGYRSRLKRVLDFVKNTYVPDLLQVAKTFPQYLEIGAGCGNFLSYGVFRMDDADERFLRPGVLIGGAWHRLQADRISEDVAHSRFGQKSGLHPSRGETKPEPGKSSAYSWIKSPRYEGNAMEVGPLARVLTNYHDPNCEWVKKEVDGVLRAIEVPAERLVSVLGRHLARGLEALWVSRQAFRWLDEIRIGGEPAEDFTIPESAEGIGLTEAPRGALGHWLSIKNHRIDRYQCIVPTTWNCSPRDDRNQPGPVEQALEGARVSKPLQPIEVGRIIRSFDPCIACAVH